MTDAEPPIQTYRGSCHCGAFIYEVEAPEIKSAGDCNCSICYKRGYLWLVPKKPLTVVKDEGKLVSYSFASKMLDHQFCGSCGTTVMAKSEMFPAGVGLNVRTIQGLDFWSLEVKTSNGNTYGTPYAAPPFSGDEPAPAGFEDGKTYHGSCHCGAVATAVRVKGSLEDGTYDERLMECNCSFCRQGYVWIYPSSSQLAIQGRDNLFYYKFGNHIWRKLFCKTCGVHIASEVNPDQTEEEIAALPEMYQQFRATHFNTQPLNLRVVNGLDVKSLKVIRGDGWSKQIPQYVYP
ncbi:Mss4-like protein [Chaetomium fimeti]|uniref:Mss4-like protein n=1 Tax=Chaetomium fimeti TaxID=1854472 RepID=A0AAE0LNQ7_9PEZI|nr:Mss4-like protein [Chaetomium fimeti]